MKFVICTGCNHIRAIADMAATGKCIYCPRHPRLLPPPAPVPVTRHPAVLPESDALTRYLAARKGQG